MHKNGKTINKSTKVSKKRLAEQAAEEEAKKEQANKKAKIFKQNRNNPAKEFKTMVEYKEKLMTNGVSIGSAALWITPRTKTAWHKAGTKAKLDFECTDDFGDRLFSYKGVIGVYKDKPNDNYIFVNPEKAGNQWAMTIIAGTYKNCKAKNVRYIFN